MGIVTHEAGGSLIRASRPESGEGTKERILFRPPCIVCQIAIDKCIILPGAKSVNRVKPLPADPGCLPALAML